MIPGIHVSTAGGIGKAPERLRNLGLAVGQIFTASQRRWEPASIPSENAEAFRNESRGMLFVSHASYLINPASSTEDVREKSRKALRDEMARCRMLEIPFMVIHPGAYQNNGLEKGISLVAGALEEAVQEVPDGPLVLLENAAGAGTAIGSRFEELAEIRELSGVPERIGFCIDTAHAHGAGYKVGGNSFEAELNGVLSLKNIRVFHMNGSKVEMGSRRDRHEHFHSGTLKLDRLKALYSNPVFEKTPAVAETPGTDDERAADIRLLEN